MPHNPIGWVYAVRRDCNAKDPTCAEVCISLIVFVCRRPKPKPLMVSHISVDSDSDIDDNLINGYDSPDGAYSSSDDDDEASVDVDRRKITGLSKVSAS